MEIRVPNMTPELLDSFRQRLGEPDAADDESALFSHVAELQQSAMAGIARKHGCIVEAIIRAEGEVVTMRDGRQYKVGGNGQWVRVDNRGSAETTE